MVYLDNNATTQIEPRVLDKMMPFLTTQYGNAASNHPFGILINESIKEARDLVADLLHCNSTDIVFTSGATEAINLAIKGVANEYKSRGNHIITVNTEHPAVLDTCASLESNGLEVTYLPVKLDGQIDLEMLEAAIRSDTILISVMFANNETGVLQPIKEIGVIAHKNKIFFMSDATQAVGKIPIDVEELGIDLLACSAHKFYGPKGVGCLYVRSKRPFKVKLFPLVHGGGHERGIRSGTLNVSGIVGMGEAARIAKAEMATNRLHIEDLRDSLESKLLSMENSHVNGSNKNRMYNVTNICFKNADSDALIAGLKDIMISNGSACSSTKTEPSHVLKALGLVDNDCYSSIRMSLSKFNTAEEITLAVRSIEELVTMLRQL